VEGVHECLHAVPNDALGEDLMLSGGVRRGIRYTMLRGAEWTMVRRTIRACSGTRTT
jgi:hypothetical protein